LLLLYLKYLKDERKQCAVSSSQWTSVREQAEGVAIMWLTHIDPSVRKQV